MPSRIELSSDDGVAGLRTTPDRPSASTRWLSSEASVVATMMKVDSPRVATARMRAMTSKPSSPPSRQSTNTRP